MRTLVVDEQKQASAMVERYFLEQTSPAILRDLRDSKSELRYDPSVWHTIVELGCPGVAISPEDGGLGLGFAVLGRIIMAAGRTLCPSPLFSTAVLGASAIELCGTGAQRSALLPLIASGALTLALAHEEGPRHNPSLFRTGAESVTGGYRLNGRKAFVFDGALADRIVVSARLDQPDMAGAGTGLFLVDHGASGMLVEPLSTVDSRNVANIVFSDVHVAESDLLGSGDMGKALDAILDRARICMAAEMYGMASTLFERTMEYLQQREQFGVKLSSFQALRHRMAKCFTELELAKSVVLGALAAIDDVDPKLSIMAAIAKARMNDVLHLISNEAVQMHGGIGVTDELDIGLFLKRARICEQAFGSTTWLESRYADLSGF